MDDKKNLRVVLYPRVSSIKQARDGDSIDAQISRLKRFCEDNDYNVVDVYTDAGKSASAKDDKRTISLASGHLSIKFNLDQRPALKSIIQRADKMEFDAVCFYKWDRFSRDVVFAKLCFQYLESLGIRLIPSDDSEDPLASSIMQILSEEEVRKMKSRVRSSRIERFNNGRMVGKAPFGYKLNKKTKNMELHQKQSKVVLDIFQMASNGASYKEVCTKHKMKPQSYYNILKNKVYYGIIEFEKEQKEGIHPKIISKELFNRCNK